MSTNFRPSLTGRAFIHHIKLAFGQKRSSRRQWSSTKAEKLRFLVCPTNIVILMSLLLNVMNRSAIANSQWNGSAGAWTTASNWSPKGIPTSASNVSIDGSNSIVSLTSSGNAASVSLTNAAQLDLNNNASLSVGGGIAFAAGTLLTMGSPNNTSNYLTGATLILSGNSPRDISGTGTIVFSPFDNNDINITSTAASSPLTLDPGITIQGAAYDNIQLFNTTSTVATVFVNQGVIDSDVGGTIRVEGDSTALWTNLGTVKATNGTITLSSWWDNTAGTFVVGSSGSLTLGGDFTPASLGTVTNDGNIQLTGIFDLQGTAELLNGSSGSWVLNGGTIHNGEIGCNGNNAFLALGGGTLDEVTLSRNATVGQLATVNSTNGLGLDNATLTIGVPGAYGSTLNFASNSQGLSGKGQIYLPMQNDQITVSGGTLAIGQGIYVHGSGVLETGSNSTIGSTITNNGTIYGDTNTSLVIRSNTGYAGTFINNGTIKNDVSITVPYFTNNGLLLSDGSQSGFAEIGAEFLQVNNGTIKAINGGIFGVAGAGSPISTLNQGTIILDSGSAVDWWGSLTMASGSIVDFYIDSARLANSNEPNLHVTYGGVLDLSAPNVSLNVSFPAGYVLPGPLLIIGSDPNYNGTSNLIGEFSNVTPGVVLDYESNGGIYIVALPEPAAFGLAPLFLGLLLQRRTRRDPVSS